MTSGYTTFVVLLSLAIFGHVRSSLIVLDPPELAGKYSAYAYQHMGKYPKTCISTYLQTVKKSCV
jgi:hypothetical protein